MQGDHGMKGSFATRFAGSADLYRVNTVTLNMIFGLDELSLYDILFPTSLAASVGKKLIFKLDK